MRVALIQRTDHITVRAIPVAHKNWRNVNFLYRLHRLTARQAFDSLFPL